MNSKKYYDYVLESIIPISTKTTKTEEFLFEDLLSRGERKHSFRKNDFDTDAVDRLKAMGFKIIEEIEIEGCLSPHAKVVMPEGWTVCNSPPPEFKGMWDEIYYVLDGNETRRLEIQVFKEGFACVVFVERWFDAPLPDEKLGLPIMNLGIFDCNVKHGADPILVFRLTEEDIPKEFRHIFFCPLFTKEAFELIFSIGNAIYPNADDPACWNDLPILRDIN